MKICKTFLKISQLILRISKNIEKCTFDYESRRQHTERILQKSPENKVPIEVPEPVSLVAALASA